MKAIILAAGFGTRLEKGLREYTGPHALLLDSWIAGKPKGLVPIQGIPVVGYQFQQLQGVGVTPDCVYVHTNLLYYDAFREWARQMHIPPENISHNGVTAHEDRKEQVRDMLLAFERVGYEEPVLLLANDTLVYGADGRMHDLTAMVSQYARDGFSRVAVYFKEEGAGNNGVVTFVGDGRVTSFREKPKDVKSGYVNASVYLFSPEKLRQMRDRAEALVQCGNPLELVWKGFKTELVSHRVDIGTLEDVLTANGLVIPP